MHTVSHSSTRKLGATNQIRVFEVIAKQCHTCGARMYGHAIFAVLRDICLQLLHSMRTIRCMHGHQTPLSPFPSS